MTMKKNILFSICFAASLLVSCGGAATSSTETAESRYRVGVCDWMILQRQQPAAFVLASRFGAEGICLDMGPLGDNPRFQSVLMDSMRRQVFFDEQEKYGQAIASIGLTGFYAQPFGLRPEFEELVMQGIETAQAMDVKILFLPLGIFSNPKDHPELRDEVVRRLRIVGDRAAAAGRVIAVETFLPAADELDFLKEIGSPGIKISVNFGRIVANGLDVVSELRTLGRENIAQIHCTNEDGVWLEHDRAVDLPAIRAALDEMEWSGWLLVERSRDATRPTEVGYNFPPNIAYVKTVFGASLHKEF